MLHIVICYFYKICVHHSCRPRCFSCTSCWIGDKHSLSLLYIYFCILLPLFSILKFLQINSFCSYIYFSFSFFSHCFTYLNCCTSHLSGLRFIFFLYFSGMFDNLYITSVCILPKQCV